MKSLYRSLLLGLAIVALTGGWVYLYANSHAVDDERQNAALAMLKDLKQMDSDWNADVLKSQAEINLSYDPLTSPLHNFSDIFVTLEGDMRKLGFADLTKAVDDVHAAIDEKGTLIDRFKAQNALLKNSLRYSPKASKDIQIQMRSMRDAGISKGSNLMREVPGTFEDIQKSLAAANHNSAEDKSRQVDAAIALLRARMKSAQLANAATQDAFALVNLESNVTALVGEALRYNSVPDQETAQLLEAGIEKLRQSSASYPADVRESVENLMTHLSVILRLRTKQSELLGDISQVPVVAKVNDLSNILTSRFAADLKEQFKYQRYLLGYSAFALLLVFGAAGIIVYRNLTERRRLAEIIDKQTRELKENEVQLVHAQKMNALGEMVAGITHEVNTPLAAVKSGLQNSRDVVGIFSEYFDESGKLATLLATPAPQDNEARNERKSILGRSLVRVNALREELNSFDGIGTMNSLIGESIGNVEYIHQVVVNMLNFSRLDRTKISAVKIETGIDSTLLMAKHFLKNRKLTKSYGETKAIQCDIAQLNQVLLNLVKNAAQALPDTGGEITIETAMASATELKVVVRDNGTGIAPENLAKIWEPFFTTKKAGSGTGLGLSTCKKIVKSHGGRIDVTSVIGEGTAFTITLPLTPPDSLYEENGQDANGARLAAA